MSRIASHAVAGAVVTGVNENRRPPFADKQVTAKQLQSYLNNTTILEDNKIDCPCCNKQIIMPHGFGPHVKHHKNMPKEKMDLSRFRDTDTHTTTQTKGKRKYTKRNKHPMHDQPQRYMMQPANHNNGPLISDNELKARAFDAITQNLHNCPRCALDLQTIIHAVTTMADVEAANK